MKITRGQANNQLIKKPGNKQKKQQTNKKRNKLIDEQSIDQKNLWSKKKKHTHTQTEQQRKQNNI